MKKIDLTNYQVGELPYDVKTSITNLMFNPELKLSGRELLAQDALAKKIEDAGGYVLLEEAEYQKVKRAFDTFSGFSRADLLLVDRVLNAQEVAVKEK